MAQHKIYDMAFSKVYPLYINKVEKKGRTQAELDDIILWLTGYSQAELTEHIEANTNFRDFFAQADHLNPNRDLITGKICGVQVELIEDPLMQNIRYLDKIVDELAKGKAIEKIKRSPK